MLGTVVGSWDEKKNGETGGCGSRHSTVLGEYLEKTCLKMAQINDKILK